MRSTVNHTAPAAMQPAPDAPRGRVMRQVRTWEASGAPIHTLIAQEVAAWFQSPGTEGIGMAQFASTGTITDDLLDDIARESTVTCAQGDDVKSALNALHAYVYACTVPAWTVGSNHAGYLPEGDVHAFLSFFDALAAYGDMLSDAPESLAGDECECGDEGDDMCDLCSLDAEVGAIFADDMPGSWDRRGTVRWLHDVRPSEERDISVALRPESAPLPTVFFLARAEWTVADVVAA